MQTYASPAALAILPATSLGDFLFMRRLRNEVRLQMTNDTSHLGMLRQLRFFLFTPPGFDIYIAWQGRSRAGYLVLRHGPDAMAITEAVDARFRRGGVATAMLRFAQARHSRIVAEIRRTNAPSIALHTANGFQLAGSRDDIAVYHFDASKAG